MQTLSDLTRAHEADQRARATVLWVKALVMASGRPHEALHAFSQLGAPSTDVARFEKAVVTPITTTADPALAFSRLHAAFLQLVARGTILGQLTGRVRPLPLKTLTPIVTPLAAADFVTESAPIPAVQLTTDQLVFMTLTKLGMILGFSKDWLLSADERVLTLLEGFLLRALREGEDAALLSSDSRVEGERPAGLLSGLSAVPGGGSSPLSLADDLGALWAAVRDAEPDSPVYITSRRGAMFLSLLREEGVPVFPSVGPMGGTIGGVPVLVTKAASNRLILLDAAALGVSDNGLNVDVSQQASVQLDTTPVDNAAQVLHSAFQHNFGFVRLVRYIDWALAYEDGVAFLELPIAA